MNSRVIITKDKVNSVIGSITQLVGKQVLVGIPEAETARQDDASTAHPTNADLGYIHEFGSPRANIPARPFLIPGVRKVLAQALSHLKGAVYATLDAKPEVADRELVTAGVIAESSAKREITTGDFVPLSPYTVANRYRQRGTQTRRANEERYLELVRGGTPAASAQAQAGIRPLINTGQLRQAITSVVRKK